MTGAEKTLKWFNDYTKTNSVYPLVAEVESQLSMAVDEERLNKAENLTISDVVGNKPNLKDALKHAVEAIYFADNSDYLSGLYGVVRSITGLDEPTEEEIKKLFKGLSPE